MEKLWIALRAANVDESVIEVLKYIYRNNKCQIKIGNTLSQAFHTSKGLLQGCPMSPTLFKVYIDVALRTWSNKYKQLGVEVSDRVYLHHLLFADDQVVISVWGRR